MEIYFFLYLSFFFITGLIFGSFANVCIYRIPRDESVSRPRSRCPACGNLISWHDNIPVISYLLLKGKCRHCAATISLRYPLVELATGLSFLLVAWQYAFAPALPVYLYFTFAMVVISGIDFSHMVIPDVFTFSLIAAGLATSFFNLPLGADAKARFLNSLTGGVLGGGGLLLVGYLGGKVFHKEAMGGGDVKLLAAAGTILGWERTLTTLFAASLLGSIAGILLISTRRLRRDDYIPFGPFLAAAAYLNLFLPGTLSWMFRF
ncbi:MAG: prepilin peptidase [Endomicrobiales bacterium]